jgi:hypothetical protein
VKLLGRSPIVVVSSVVAVEDAVGTEVAADV